MADDPSRPDPEADLSHIDPTDATTWPDTCPTCDTPLTRTRQCLGHAWDEDEDGQRTGERRHCLAVARRGSLHCGAHGGDAPQVRAAATRRLQRAQLDRDLDRQLAGLEADAARRGPTAVLLDQVHRAYAMVSVLGAQVGGLDPTRTSPPGDDEAPDTPAGLYGPDHQGDGAPHVLVSMYRQWITDAARVSKLALDAGVEERMVRLAEDQGRLLFDLVRAILDDPELGLSDGQRHAAPMVVARHLRALDTAS